MTRKKKPAKPTAPEPLPQLPRSVSSPFYPTVQPQEPVQEAKPAPVPTEEVEPSKPHRKGKVAASWAAKAVAVLVPALVSGLSSYQTAKASQEDGYITTVAAVEELQGAVEELVKQVAYLQGELDATRGEAARLHGTKVFKRRPKPELKTSVTLSKLPPDLNAAVQSKGRPMQQNSYSLAPMDSDGIFDVEDKSALDEAAKKRAMALNEMMRKRMAAPKREEAKMPTQERTGALEREVPDVVPAPPPKVEDPPAPAAPVE